MYWISGKEIYNLEEILSKLMLKKIIQIDPEDPHKLIITSEMLDTKKVGKLSEVVSSLRNCVGMPMRKGPDGRNYLVKTSIASNSQARKHLAKIISEGGFHNNDGQFVKLDNDFFLNCKKYYEIVALPVTLDNYISKEVYKNNYLDMDGGHKYNTDMV